jgi:type IV secretory pathway VirB10-like protein
MLTKHAKMFGKGAFAVAMVALIGTLAIAQEETEETEEEEDVIEEIIVYGGERPDDPVDVEALYEEMMRERLMTDIKRLEILEEQQEWRNADDGTYETSSRMSWGYSPQDELRMRRESGIPDETYITTKPATLFRYDF